MTEHNFRCPICKKEVDRQSSDFPFCSDRCRQIDLGNWADGSYSIEGDPASTSDLGDSDEPSIH